MSDIRRFGCYVAYDSAMRSLVGTREFPGGPYVYYDEHSALISQALAMAKAKDATIADLTRKLAEAEKVIASLNAELHRVRTTQHGAAHELDNIAVESGLGHSPKPGTVADVTSHTVIFATVGPCRNQVKART